MISQSSLSHIRMGLESGVLSYWEIKSPCSQSYRLVWKYFPCFKLNKCSFVLLKCVHQWSSGTPPSFSISDSMRVGSRSFYSSNRDSHRPMALHPLPGRLAIYSGPAHTIRAVKCRSIQHLTVLGFPWQLWYQNTKTKMFVFLPWDW